jgi:hypothetical protein
MPQLVMPIPVSSTDRRTCHPIVDELGRGRQRHAPLSVNFTAFDSRFRTICRIRTRVAEQVRRFAMRHLAKLDPLLVGERSINSAAPWTSPEVERIDSRSKPTGFDLREVEDVIDDRQERLARRLMLSA